MESVYFESQNTSFALFGRIIFDSKLSESHYSTDRILEKLAVVRWFDEDTLRNYIHTDEVSPLLKKIKSLSYVERRNFGFSFHDIMREEICRDIFAKSPSNFKKLNVLAADYYRERINRSSRLLSQTLIIEMAYHLILGDEDKGFFEINRLIISRDEIFQPYLCDAIIETVNGMNLKPDNLALLNKWKKTINSNKN